MNNTAGFTARTPKPYSDRAEGTEEAREFARQGASYTKDMYERTKAAAEETNRVIEQTYSALAKSAADFNVQWIEIVRFNTNSAFDFSRQLVGVKSPSEFLELWRLGRNFLSSRNVGGSRSLAQLQSADIGNDRPAIARRDL